MSIFESVTTNIEEEKKALQVNITRFVHKVCNLMQFPIQDSSQVQSLYETADGILLYPVTHNKDALFIRNP